jgi:hypothetical protein
VGNPRNPQQQPGVSVGAAAQDVAGLQAGAARQPDAAPGRLRSGELRPDPGQRGAAACHCPGPLVVPPGDVLAVVDDLQRAAGHGRVEAPEPGLASRQGEPDHRVSTAIINARAELLQYLPGGVAVVDAGLVQDQLPVHVADVAGAVIGE